MVNKVLSFSSYLHGIENFHVGGFHDLNLHKVNIVKFLNSITNFFMKKSPNHFSFSISLNNDNITKNAHLQEPYL